MIHLRSTCHRDRHTKMNGELRAGRTTTGKRGSSDHDRSDCDMEYTGYPGEHYNRVFDYQRVPSSVPVDSIHVKRPRPSSSSSSSSSTAALRAKNSRVTNRSNKTHNSMSGSSNVKLKMAELLAIKSELTVIKVQIDGLLDCVDKMDRQRKDCSGVYHFLHLTIKVRTFLQSEDILAGPHFETAMFEGEDLFLENRYELRFG
ncbi:uncharacterized protein LOC110959664 isoform X4 [Acanthochromis polyacanthus]|uniref:uncharacterized protein LOC110959664 isoform X4 n=1 Tax=Acanthochromis polyacanthus TaxID=80966 RepID=UPI0022343EC2|nr:uncharacterized protein LOC110959664 isoform X4 [Acanthochromis polyacanthus]